MKPCNLSGSFVSRVFQNPAEASQASVCEMPAAGWSLAGLNRTVTACVAFRLSWTGVHASY